MSILAALIEYNDGGITRYVGVTDGEYTVTTGVTLKDGLWYPALDSDVNWSEQARHPYQEQGGELVVGDLVLANQSGVFDFLLTADIVGMKVTLKRGYESDTWADMEQIFIARIAGRRFEGYSVLIELENWLAKLAGPVYTETFGSDTPNPQLVGKQIPYVLGRVTQAPVLLYDPNSLTYYTAANASLIGEVAEGGNPTQKWTLEDQPTFNLLGSPTLPITANFEGPGASYVDLLSSIGSFESWTSGEPDGWTVYDYDEGGLDSEAQSNLGVISEHADGAAVVADHIYDHDGSMSSGLQWGEGVDESGTVSEWLNPLNLASVGGSGAWLYYYEGVRNQRIRGRRFDTIVLPVPSRDIDAPLIIGSFAFSIHSESSVTSGQLPVIANVHVKSDAVDRGETVSAYQIPDGTVRTGFISEGLELWGSDYEYSKQIDFENMEVTISVATEGEGIVALRNLRVWAHHVRQPWPINIYWDGLTLGRRYIARVHYDSSGDSISAIASSVAAVNDDVLTNGDRTNVALLDGKGSADLQVEADDTVLGVSFLTREGTETGSQIITQVELFEQQAANTSYKSLAPAIIEEVGYTSSEYDQTTFDTHADEYGDPELGWLITGNETADQTLFRLAGSLNGYVWHGLDGKVRSKRLEAPADPGGTPFVIDSTRADPAEIVAYDDDAPNLRRSINALRNWQPLKADDTAGITTTWTEADRAKVTQDWRITRVWESTSDQKDVLERRWPMVASREPLSTALRDATTAQLVANEGMDTWISRPTFYEVPTQVEVGEFSDVATGETVKVKLDYPGLEDTWALVLGRSGTSTPGKVTLTLWVNGITPLTLLAENRIDPRISVTRASKATRWNEQGLLEEVGEDVLRANYDPMTLEFDGWLIEDSATNQYADAVGLSDFALTRFTQTTVADASPMGTDAQRIDRTATGNSYILNDNHTLSAGDKVLSMIMVKSITDARSIGTRFWAGSGQAWSQNITVYVDTATGDVTVGSGSPDDYGAMNLGGGWWLLWVAATAPSNGSNAHSAVFSNDSWPGNTVNDSFYAWGAHMVLGLSRPTSVIPTPLVPQTRAADDVLIDGTDFSAIWNDSEGTIVGEAVSPDGDNTEVFRASSGALVNSIRARRAASGVATGDVRDASGTSEFYDSNYSVDETWRFAFGVSNSEDAAFYANGDLVEKSPSTISSAIDRIQFGLGSGSIGIRALYYYPKRLTDEQLQEASTLGRDLVLDKV